LYKYIVSKSRMFFYYLKYKYDLYAETIITRYRTALTGTDQSVLVPLYYKRIIIDIILIYFSNDNSCIKIWGKITKLNDWSFHLFANAYNVNAIDRRINRSVIKHRNIRSRGKNLCLNVAIMVIIFTFTPNEKKW